MSIKELYNLADKRIIAWMARYGITLMRVVLGIIFLWFGVLKFLPGISVSDDLATRTISVLSLGYVSPTVSLPMLAALECAIGLGLIFGKFLRVTLLLLLLQMMGTFLPLVFFPAETWTHIPYEPTLEGQYIIKNLILLGAGIVVGATVRGGNIKSEPKSAHEAQMNYA
jgi:uncharacterized membrane protein YphA (DoxX/SURF4 family)